MSVNSYARVSGYALIYFALSCGGGDSSTGPGTGNSSTVALTASPSSMTQLGAITLTATVSGGTVPTHRVEFYEKTVGSNAVPTLVGEDSVAPFSSERMVASSADNGTKEFTASAYSGGTRIATSDPIRVVINLADTVTLGAAFYMWGHRITTPGDVRFMVKPNKPITRIEVYDNAKKVAEDLAPVSPYVIRIAVTAVDNGNHSYVVKAYDARGTSVETSPIPFVVDIKWTLVQNVAAFRSSNAVFIATDVTNAVYYAGTTDTYNVFLVKYDADGHQSWARTFGGSDNEYAGSVAVDASGRVYVAGSHYYSGQINNFQCFVNIYDAGGELLESRQIVPALRASGCVARPDASGNLYVAGHTSDATTGWWFLTKYGRDGTEVWSRDIKGTPVPGSQFRGSELTDISVAPDGGVYVAGYTSESFDGAPNRGPRDIFVLKFGSDGNRLWANQYGTPGFLTFSARLTPDPTGGVYLSGSTDDPDNRFIHSDALIASYDADGTRRWARTIDGGWADVGYSVVADSRGIYLVGETFGWIGPHAHLIAEPSQGPTDQSTLDLFVAKFSLIGALVEVRLLGTRGGDYGSDVLIGVNGDIYIAGGTVDEAAFTTTPFLARYRDAP